MKNPSVVLVECVPDSSGWGDVIPLERQVMT